MRRPFSSWCASNRSLVGMDKRPARSHTSNTKAGKDDSNLKKTDLNLERAMRLIPRRIQIKSRSLGKDQRFLDWINDFCSTFGLSILKSVHPLPLVEQHYDEINVAMNGLWKNTTNSLFSTGGPENLLLGIRDNTTIESATLFLIRNALIPACAHNCVRMIVDFILSRH